ncbi:MAG: NHLP bacteriocin system secretion protein [Acidobacteria bacterium]|nr:MAG: NHLP bacteriocin system secretion protein [Acidobacteriota bacterium]
MQEQLFRKKALERLSSPEQLDLLMQVTNSKGWLALAALGIILTTALLWSIFGSIPTKVYGQGILIRTGGVYEVVTLGAGRVTEINVQPGDLIGTGQIVARVAQPELLDQIKTAEAELADLENEHATLVEYTNKDLQNQSDLFAESKSNAEEAMRTAEERVRYYEQRIKAEEELFHQGVIVEKQLLATKDELLNKQDEITKAREQLKGIAVRELAMKNKADQDLTASKQKINDQKRRIDAMRNELDLTSRVISRQEGRVLEIRTDVGKIVSLGTPILSIESSNSALEALFYIPPADGKRVHAGMEAHVAPSTVKKEEFGLIEAKVKSISGFPSSSQAMMRVLGNESLVQTLSASGAPFEVHADLIVDSKTESGFRWSSADGPPVKIYSGTLCTGLVTVRKQRPITLVIPYLREKLGV